MTRSRRSRRCAERGRPTRASTLGAQVPRAGGRRWRHGREGTGLRRRLTSVRAADPRCRARAVAGQQRPRRRRHPRGPRERTGSGPAPLPAHASRSERAPDPAADLDRSRAGRPVGEGRDQPRRRDLRLDARLRARSDGNWASEPDAFETRKRWARAIGSSLRARRAARSRPITFPDVDPPIRSNRGRRSRCSTAG